MLSPWKSRPDPLQATLASKPAPDAPGGFIDRPVASGPGWRVRDIVCTCGPHDRPFEERHAGASVSIVLGGSFVYRDGRGSALMAPGAMLLGDPGRAFECSHDHAAGDRCLSFQLDPDYFARVAEETQVPRPAFARAGLPPLRPLAAVAMRARLALENESQAAEFEEITLELAGGALRLGNDLIDGDSAAPAARDLARVARVIRDIESDSAAPHTLDAMAESAGMSRYHFLRAFRRVAGVTPHQWLMRIRMRAAARMLAATRASVTAIALEAGFDDLSNFIRTFRAEFGASPRAWRKHS